ncbi:hypothetical protein [Planktothrix sp. FACHB-1365]|uniref:hypothetical protein n=1 Tax=Planktothrix sp. FACHB-1365 TaxID=2692855 RepID=UPI0016843F94|nr:hypothetical protein [Planktothrix sp. FACHB-1365]MBD2481549.1 hypothetical protein [Planktothrix sp. FACHB-1365]
MGHENNELMLIEAKGIATREFKRQLQLIDCNFPHLIPKITIVQQQSQRIDECFRSVTPKEMIKDLKIISFHINHYKPTQKVKS